jgi:hypothetical protein
MNMSVKKIYQTSHTVSGVRTKTRESILWYGIKNRCYGGRHKSYTGCSMSENFLDFQFFARWCNNQIGWNEDGWHLDKDFLVEGNKVYSEDTCLFVPRVINNIFSDTPENSSGLTGAVWISHSNKYQARCSEFGKQYSYGLYPTAEEAHNVWVEKKNEYVQKVSEMYKGRVRDEVYHRLVNFKAK